MHAVVVNVTISDEEGSVAALREQVVPRVSQAPGFVAAYWTRKGNGGLSMSVWQSEDQANAASRPLCPKVCRSTASRCVRWWPAPNQAALLHTPGLYRLTIAWRRGPDRSGLPRSVFPRVRCRHRRPRSHQRRPAGHAGDCLGDKRASGAGGMLMIAFVEGIVRRLHVGPVRCRQRIAGSAPT
jgi:hypothetical protein